MFHATTILAYKKDGHAVIGGDGQVSFGNTVLKGNATKIRTLYNGKVLGDSRAAQRTPSTSSICSRRCWTTTRGTCSKQP